MFTHSSWAPDRGSSYERLEFLGDSVLELSVARALYERYPDFSEGRLAKIRSHVVSRQSCARVARELELGPMLRERGRALPDEELEKLTRNRNVLAALLEAALAALFLEHGFEKVEPAIVAAFSEQIEYAATQHVDYKTDAAINPGNSAARCSTPVARHRDQHGRSRATRPASASRSRSTSPSRSCARPSPASRWPARTSGSTTGIDPQFAKEEQPAGQGRRPRVRGPPTRRPGR